MGLFLVLDHADAGHLVSMEGGAVSATVVATPMAGSALSKKSLGETRFEAVTISAGLGLAPALADWIAPSWEGRTRRVDGSVITVDEHFSPVTQLDFFGALPAETVVPTLDRGSTAQGALKVRITPSLTRERPSDRRPIPPPGPDADRWRVCDFRLAIDGLDIHEVLRIDSFAVGLGIEEGEVGDPRGTGRVQVDIPDLRVTVSGASARSWIDWHADFVVRGNSADAMERTGTLTFLSPDGRRQLAVVRLAGLGIHRLTRDRSVDPGPAPPATAELYCERMEFQGRPR